MSKIDMRKSICVKLSRFDCMAKDEDYIEVTQWTNGEGVDVNINDKFMSFTYGELEALIYLTKTLEYPESDE